MITQTIQPGTAFVSLGDAHPHDVSTYVLGLVVPSGSMVSCTPRGRVRGSTRPLDATAPALYYESRTTGVGSPGTTPITADGIYAIVGDGLEVGLDLTVTGGPVTIAASPVRG